MSQASTPIQRAPTPMPQATQFTGYGPMPYGYPGYFGAMQANAYSQAVAGTMFGGGINYGQPDPVLGFGFNQNQSQKENVDELTARIIALENRINIKSEPKQEPKRTMKREPKSKPEETAANLSTVVISSDDEHKDGDDTDFMPTISSTRIKDGKKEE